MTGFLLTLFWRIFWVAILALIAGVTPLIALIVIPLTITFLWD